MDRSMEVMEKIGQRIERIKDILPEYIGYHQKEYIADSDRLLRHHLAREMEKYKRSLQLVREKLSLEGGITVADKLQDTILRMEKLEQEFRSSSYETDEYKHLGEISEDKLEQVYNYDIALLDHIEGLNSATDRLDELRDSPESFKRAFSFLKEALDNLEEQFKRRGHILRIS